MGEKSQFPSVIFVKNFTSVYLIHSGQPWKTKEATFGDNPWLLLSGSKGGKNMKFRFEVISCRFRLKYEGSDSHSEMTLVLPKFYEVIDSI